MAQTTTSRQDRIPAERVRPMVLWLVQQYGDISTLAEAMGVSKSTVEKWAYGIYATISRQHAQKISEFVLIHRRPKDALSAYENETTPRLAVSLDYERARRAQKWQAVDIDGKDKRGA